MLAPLAALTACAQAVRVYHYSWGNIVTASPADVNAFCHGYGAVWDNGEPIMRWQSSVGCFKDGVIMVQNTCEGAKALPHELAHLDGHRDPAKDGFSW